MRFKEKIENWKQKRENRDVDPNVYTAYKIRRNRKIAYGVGYGAMIIGIVASGIAGGVIASHSETISHRLHQKTSVRTTSPHQIIPQTPIKHTVVSSSSPVTFNSTGITNYLTAYVKDGGLTYQTLANNQVAFAMTQSGFTKGLSFILSNSEVLPMTWTHDDQTYQINGASSQGVFCDAVFQAQLLLPNTLTAIGANLFANAWFDQNLTLPASLQTINSDAFQGTDFNAQFIGSGSVVNVAPNAFNNTSFAENFTLFGNNLHLQTYAFRNAIFSQNFTLKNTPILMAKNAFQFAEFKGDVSLPAQVANNDANAFDLATFAKNDPLLKN